MTALEALAVFVAGLAAGAVNTIVGAGTLLTFSTLVAIGVHPLVANVSNTIGLVPGSFSGAVAYRRHLAGQRRRLLRLGAASVLGGLTGGVLLLVLPPAAFDAIVPALLVLGAVLVAFQPRIAAFARAPHGRHAHGGPALAAAIFAAGVYGGYFGAAQGVLLLAAMGIWLTDSLQVLNAIKNVLAGMVNLVAALLFVALAPVHWGVVALIAVGSVLGAQVGAAVGMRLPPAVLRAAIVVVGLAVAARLALR